MRAFILTLLVASACAEAKYPDPETARRQSLNSARAELDALSARMRKVLVWAECTPENAHEPCGLLLEQMRGTYSHCADDACWSEALAAYDAGLRRRYSYAREDQVNAVCTSRPADCANLVATELVWLRIHNERGFAFWREEKDRIIREAEERDMEIVAEATRQEEDDAARRRMVRAIGASMAAAGQSMQANRPVVTNCTPMAGSVRCETR